MSSGTVKEKFTTKYGLYEQNYQDLLKQGGSLTRRSSAPNFDLEGFRVYDDPNAQIRQGDKRPFREMSQETLDHMLSMFQQRKENIDQRRRMPGSSQLTTSMFDIG